MTMPMPSFAPSCGSVPDPFVVAQSLVYREPHLALQVLTNRVAYKNFSMVFNLASGQEGTGDDQILDNNACDIVVAALIYTVHRPEFLVDSPALKPAADLAFAAMPYLSLELGIDGCQDRRISDGPDPIENVARCAPANLGGCTPAFGLYANEKLKGRIQLLRTFSEETGEVPMRVTVTAQSYILGCSNCIELMDVDQVLAELAVHGLKVDRKLLSRTLR